MANEQTTGQAALDAAGYVVEKAAGLVANITGDLITEIPSVINRIASGEIAGATLDVGFIIGGNVVRTGLAVAADGTFVLATEAGQVLWKGTQAGAQGIAELGAKAKAKGYDVEFAGGKIKLHTPEGVAFEGDLSAVTAHLDQGQETRGSGTEFVTLKIGGKDWTVTKGTDQVEMKIIDDQGTEHQLDSPAGRNVITHLDQHLKRQRYEAPTTLEDMLRNFQTSGAGGAKAIDDNTFGLYSFIYDTFTGKDFDKWVEEEQERNPTAFASGRASVEALSLALGPGLIGKAARVLNWAGRRTIQSIAHTRARKFNRSIVQAAEGSFGEVTKKMAKKFNISVDDLQKIRDAGPNPIELAAARQRIAQNSDLSKWGLQNFLGLKGDRLLKRNLFNEWKASQAGIGNKFASIMKNPWDNPIVKVPKTGKYIPEWITPNADADFIGQAFNFVQQVGLDATKDIAPFVGEQIASMFFIQKKAKDNYLAQGISEEKANEWAWAYTWGRMQDTALAAFVESLPFPFAGTAARGFEIYNTAKDFDAEGFLLPPDSEITEQSEGFTDAYANKGGKVNKMYGGMIQ